MALNPAFASASVNPSQTMGNDASVNPTQGALPTGTSATQNTGFSGLGGMNMNYVHPKEPEIPMIPNFNQSYYQSPQYQNYKNSLETTAATDDYRMMPFGGYGSSNIANLQNQSYEDFLKNPNMGQPQGNMSQFEIGVPPDLPDGYLDYTSSFGRQFGLTSNDTPSALTPQQWMANKPSAYNSGDTSSFNPPQQGQPATQEVPNYEMPMGDDKNIFVQNDRPMNYQQPQGNMPQIGRPLGRFIPATTLPDGTRNSEGGSYEYPQDPPSRYTYFGDDKADYSQLGLSQSALDSLNMMRQAPDMGQFYYDTQTKTFGQGVGYPGPNTPGQRRYTGKTGIPLELMNKLGSGEYPDFSKYAQYDEGTPVIQPQDVAQLPEQQPGPTPPLTPQQQDYTNPSDFEGLTFATSMDGFQTKPMFHYEQGTSREAQLRNEAPYMTRENYANSLNQLRRPAESGFGSTGRITQPVQQPQVLNGVTGTPTSPLTPTATPTGTTPMATNPLSQVPVPQAAAFTPAPIVGTPSSGGGSFTQGAPLPNITTTQQQVTAAPEFYTDYLNQLAKQGASTAQNAQYVGATDLQNQAFDRTSQNVGNYQSALQNAINLAQNVGSSNLSEAIGNLGQANIARNLSPQATAGIVGSGQFGSKRGAAALGDTIANAQLGITAQQATALQQDMQNRLAAAQQLGNLASTTQQLGLGDINALATMGGQKQTIAQNEQLFPMQQLTNQSQLLRGYTIPTSTGSSYTGPIPGAYAASPLQQIAGLGALGAGISNTPLGSALFGTSPTIDPKTGLVTNAGTSGIIGKGITALTGGAKDLFSYLNTPGTNETNLPPITIPGGGTATPNGDGTYTTSDGRIVGVDGNPIPGYVYPDPGGNNETPFPGNFDYNDTTPPIPTDETYNSWFGD